MPVPCARRRPQDGAGTRVRSPACGRSPRRACAARPAARVLQARVGDRVRRLPHGQRRVTPAPAASQGATPCTGAAGRGSGSFPGGRRAERERSRDRARPCGRKRRIVRGPRPRAGSSRPRADIKGQSSARGAASRPAAPHSSDPGIRSERAPAPRPARQGFETRLAGFSPVKFRSAVGSSPWGT